MPLVHKLRRQTDTFSSSGTWTKQPWAKFVFMNMSGAGGGGGSGRRGAAGSARSGGVGGWAGAQFIGSFGFDAALLPDTVSVTIGAAGVGAAAITVDDTNGNAGTDGGNTTFGTLYNARGGFGGLGGTNASVAVLPAGMSADGRLPPLATSITGALTATTSQLAGGSGGSLSTANAELFGASGGPAALADQGPGADRAAAGAAGAPGANGVLASAAYGAPLYADINASGGGGGGGPSAAAAAGAGGNAATGGARGGGGGGGASVNGQNSGAGGNGAGGWLTIIQEG